MKLLLDTHIFLWWLEDNPKLLPYLALLISDASNVIYVSDLSLWEIKLKESAGKLGGMGDLEKQIQSNAFLHLPITRHHILSLNTLPMHHKDPFDRLLISQAREENLTFLSMDKAVQLYQGHCFILPQSDKKMEQCQ